MNLDLGPRRSGRTTRIVDECIQEFFKNGFVACYDHYGSSTMNKMVQERVCGRLYKEHRLRDFKPLKVGRIYLVAMNDSVEEARRWANLTRINAI